MNFIAKYKDRIILYLFVALTASFLLSIALMQIILGMILIFWLFEKDKFKALDTFSLLFVVYVLFRVISVFTSPYLDLSITTLYKEVMFYVSFYAFMFYFKKYDFRRKEILIEIFVYIAAVTSIIGIINFSFNFVNRAQTFSSGYATFSSYLLYALTFYLFFINNKKEIKTWAKVVIGTFILSAIILALSRSDIAIALLILFAALVFKKIKIIPLFLIFAATALLCYGAFSLNSKELNGRVKQPTAFSERDILWKSAYDLRGEHVLFGFGPRTFNKVFINRDKLVDQEIGAWHNDYISLYIESGLCGLISFLIFIGYLIKKGFLNYYHNRQNEKLKTFFWVMLVSIFAALFSAFFSGFVSNPILSVVFGYMAAMLGSEINRRQEMVIVP